MKHECGYCGKIWDCGFPVDQCRWGVVRHFCAKCESKPGIQYLSPRGERKAQKIISRLVVKAKTHGR